MRWLGLAAALASLEFLSGPGAAADSPSPRESPHATAPPAPAASAAPARTPPAAAKAPSAAPPVLPSSGAPTSSQAGTTTTAPPVGAQPASAQPGSAAEAAPSAAPPPPSGPPPQYYVEPQAPAEAAHDTVYEPPPPAPPIYEPPPPAEPHSLAPRTALWVGVRVAWLVPFGSLWVDGFSGSNGYAFRRRTFASYASPGPALELDVGARLSRRYMIFALFEHASFGAGSLDDRSFGGQDRGVSHFYGAGLRFSTEPSRLGFGMEVALGYRDFRAYWADGTELAMTDGFLDARIGLGADIRVNRWLSLSPMIVLGGGSFGTGRWSGPGGSQSAMTSSPPLLDSGGQYGTLALQLGGHVDLY